MKMRFACAGSEFYVDGETPKDLFVARARIEDVFGADIACGRCGGTELRCRVRQVDDNDYHEWFCAACRATLSMGQTRAGGLFPKRKDKDGNILDKRGWRPPFGEREPTEEPAATAMRH